MVVSSGSTGGSGSGDSARGDAPSPFSSTSASLFTSPAPSCPCSAASPVTAFLLFLAALPFLTVFFGAFRFFFLGCSSPSSAEPSASPTAMSASIASSSSSSPDPPKRKRSTAPFFAGLRFRARFLGWTRSSSLVDSSAASPACVDTIACAATVSASSASSVRRREAGRRIFGRVVGFFAAVPVAPGSVTPPSETASSASASLSAGAGALRFLPAVEAARFAGGSSCEAFSFPLPLLFARSDAASALLPSSPSPASFAGCALRFRGRPPEGATGGGGGGEASRSGWSSTARRDGDNCVGGTFETEKAVPRVGEELEGAAAEAGRGEVSGSGRKRLPGLCGDFEPDGG